MLQKSNGHTHRRPPCLSLWTQSTSGQRSLFQVNDSRFRSYIPELGIVNRTIDLLSLLYFL